MSKDTHQCMDCPNGYPYSKLGATSVSECYLITEPGKYVRDIGGAQIDCEPGSFCPGGAVVYNSQYIPVEYIQSDGVAYINTGKRPNASTAVYLHFDSTTDCESGKDRVIFGSRTKMGSFDSFVIATHARVLGYNLHFDAFGISRISTTIGGDITFFIDKDSYSINGVRTDWNTDNRYIGNDWDMYLFAWNNSNELMYSSQSKLYEYKLWDDGVLVQDFVPVYDVVNNVYGMFDNVSQTFFGNQGGGRFLGSLTGKSNMGILSCAEQTGDIAPSSASGAKSIDDCGNRLRFAKWDLFLRSARRTVPALVVEYNGHVFYGDMSTEQRGHLRALYKEKVYSIYNADID
ncbi:MAG: hypothetical protein K2M34_00470 [Alphaproteobacteria bacterium]|nr:hypothetical protein [Alphaproteobacteria bacterium]